MFCENKAVHKGTWLYAAQGIKKRQRTYTKQRGTHHVLIKTALSVNVGVTAMNRLKTHEFPWGLQ